MIEGTFQEDNNLTSKVSKYLDQIVELLVQNYVPDKNLVKLVEADDPMFYQKIGKLYANFPEEDVNQALKAITKKQLLHFKKTQARRRFQRKDCIV